MKIQNKKGAMHADQSTAKLQKMTAKNRQPHNNTKSPDLSTLEPYCSILNSIGTGEKNAVHLEVIMRKTGLKNREIRKCVEELRRSGEVIAANKNGYFKPENAAELQKYIKQETQRAKSVFYTLKNARQLMERIKER